MFNNLFELWLLAQVVGGVLVWGVLISGYGVEAGDKGGSQSQQRPQQPEQFRSKFLTTDPLAEPIRPQADPVRVGETVSQSNQGSQGSQVKNQSQSSSSQGNQSEYQSKSSSASSTASAAPQATPAPGVAPRAVAYSISVPKDSKWQPEKATAFIEHVLTSMQGTAILRIVADHESIRWEMVDYLVEYENSEAIAKGLRTIYPEAEVAISEYQPPLFVKPFNRAVIPFMLGGELRDKNESIISSLTRKAGLNWVLPTKYVEDTKTNDPLMAVVQGLGGDLKPGSRATLTICTTGFTDMKVRKKGQDALKASNINWFNVGMNMTSVTGAAVTAVELGIGALTGGLKRDRFNEKDQKLAEAKPYLKALWNTYVIVQVDAQDGLDLANALHSMTALLVGYKTDYNWFDPAPFNPNPKSSESSLLVSNSAQDEATSAFGLMRRFNANKAEGDKFMCILSAHEIATLFHLPHEQFKTTTIKWLDMGRPSEAIIKNTAGALIGSNGKNQIKLPDTGDPKHTNIIGKSGTGKSTLMINLIQQDIAAGRGVAVVDPHGKMIRDILRSCIPDERIDDVVLIDIANADYPPPLNPLSLPDEQGQIGVGQVMAILEKVYGFKSAPRAAHAMEIALKTLRFEKQPNIRDAEELLTDTLKRQKLLQKYSRQLDPASIKFWKRFGDMSISAQDELTFPVTNRLQRFYTSHELYAMMCHPDTLNWGKLMFANLIILVSLRVNKAIVPPSEQQLLGTLVVSQLEIAAHRFGEEKGFDFHLYVDEAQKFVTTSLPDMFEEIRKFGVWLTIANQYLGQMTGDTLTAVMGNTTTTYAFEVSADDARELAPYVRSVFDVADLVALGKHHAVVKTSLHNIAQPAFRIDTLPPPPEYPDADAREARIRERSIEQWTPTTREQVLTWLRKRYPDEEVFMPQPQPDTETDTGDDWEVDAN